MLTVLAVSQAIGLAGLLTWVVVTGESFPGAQELLPAVGAGIAGVIGLGALYRGFAVGAMGIVAPISAAAPIIPLVADATNGDVPAPLQWLGIALVLVGIGVLSREPASTRNARIASGAGLAIVAALGFGLFVVGIDAGSDESPAWAVVVARSAAVPLAVFAALVTSTSLRPAMALVPMLVVVGIGDVSANVLVATATTYGAAGIVAVLSTIYPVVTVVLARLVLREKLSRVKRAGGVVALAGAALVAAG